MVNLKSLFAILAFVSLLLVIVGFARFGVDLWHYHHTSVGLINQLDYRGLGVAASGAILFGVFILLFRWRKN